MFITSLFWMENLRSSNSSESKERQETLKKIREYILSLLIKKQSKAKEIEKILEETPKTKNSIKNLNKYSKKDCSVSNSAKNLDEFL